MAATPFVRPSQKVRQTSHRRGPKLQEIAKNYIGGDDDDEDDTSAGWELPSHPLGIHPESQGVLDVLIHNRRCGLGVLSSLTDSALLLVLEFLDAVSLVRFGQCSTWCYAFSRSEPLWRDLVSSGHLRAVSPAVSLGTTSTSIPVSDDDNGHQAATGGQGGQAGGDGDGEGGEEVKKRCSEKAVRWQRSWYQTATGQAPQLRLNNVYSDELYAGWRVHCIPMQESWVERDNVPRIDVDKCSPEEFARRFEAAGKPVVIRGAVNKWPAFQKWTREYLASQFGHTLFTAGPVEMTLEDYLRYSDENHDEVPLYLFDKRFGEKASGLAADYSQPPYFDSEDHDLFRVLAEARPAFRWLIIGAERSGSRFHQDPNATSAWNAVIRGSKKWIFFPPEVTPPGVFPSADGADVTSPLSLLEWFTNFYDTARQLPGDPMRECIVSEGELMFVPSRWWHLVINLDWCVAITQNFVSKHNLAAVLQFLEHQPDCVSGMLTDDYDKHQFSQLFYAALQTHKPHLMAPIEADKAERDRYASMALAWDQVANDPDADSFAFLADETQEQDDEFQSADTTDLSWFD